MASAIACPHPSTCRDLYDAYGLIFKRCARCKYEWPCSRQEGQMCHTNRPCLCALFDLKPPKRSHLQEFPLLQKEDTP